MADTGVPGSGVFDGGRQWHELANLAGAILSDVELLGQPGPHPADTETRAAELLAIDSRRLRRLVDQLKAAWDITSGSAQVRVEPTELAPLVEAAAARAGRVDPGSTDIPSISLATDRTRLASVLVELMSNALDHGGGSYRVTAEAAETEVAIVVADEGPGIDATDEGNVFDPWYRGEGSPGAGLGLWLARAQVELLGGSLGLDTRSNGGLRAALRLPI